MDALQNMRRRDVGHVEGRILAHQNDVGGRQIVGGGFAEDEVIVLRISHGQRTGPRGHQPIAKGEVARPVIEQRMAAGLRFQRERKGGIARDVDALDRVHLDGNSERHPLS